MKSNKKTFVILAALIALAGGPVLAAGPWENTNINGNMSLNTSFSGPVGSAGSYGTFNLGAVTPATQVGGGAFISTNTFHLAPSDNNFGATSGVVGVSGVAQQTPSGSYANAGSSTGTSAIANGNVFSVSSAGAGASAYAGF
ncbi:MAG: hypothetical protein WAV50_02265 [Minisyncoccia bacterium]